MYGHKCAMFFFVGQWKEFLHTNCGSDKKKLQDTQKGLPHKTRTTIEREKNVFKPQQQTMPHHTMTLLMNCGKMLEWYDNKYCHKTNQTTAVACGTAKTKNQLSKKDVNNCLRTSVSSGGC